MSERWKQLVRVFLFLLIVAGTAFAQFEIAPDHFPGNDEPSVQPPSKRAARWDRRITEQQAILSEYRAQIKTKTDQVVAASQALQFATSSTEQMDAIVTQQRELEKLLKSLASAVRAEELTLSRLQHAQAMKGHGRLKQSAYVAATRRGT